MKKFITAMCGIIVATSAMGRGMLTPLVVSDKAVQESWQYSTSSSSSYTSGVEGIFAPSWQFNTRAGTYGSNNEGSIVAIVARDIWKNGGLFCTTQIQSAWSGSRDWIDYYKSGKYLCETICKPGYSGDKCSDAKYDCSKPNKNYKKDLNDIANASLRLLSGEQDGNITKEMRVFDRQNDDSNSASYAVVLGVIKRMEHGIIVTPIRVNAKRRGTIESAYSNGKKTLLCAPGYEANKAGDDCELSTWCGGEIKQCSDDTMVFNESQHTWEMGKEADGRPCKFIICKSGYGFKENSKTCVPCETTRKQGINSTNGVCKQCGDNQMFQDGECHDYITYSAQDLVNGVQRAFDCWLEKDPVNYGTCVKCAQPKKYNATEHTCQ